MKKKSLKKILKKIFPLYVYNKLAPHLNLNDYVGVYDNQIELKINLSKTDISQIIGDNDVKNEHVAAQIEKNRNLSDDFKNNKRETWAPRETFLCNALTLFPSKEINILDIGGGLRPCYFTLNYSLSQNIKCHVMEFENIVKGAKEIFSNIPNLTYSSEYPINEIFDVIYFGSSIQYFDDLDKIFNKIKNYQSKIIVFSYSPFAEEHKTFTTGAYTFHRKFITPTTIYNINEFIDYFSKNNYKLKHKSLLEVSNSPIQDSLGIKTRTYNLVFKKDI